MAKIYFDSLVEVQVELVEDAFDWSAKLDELRNQYGTITKIVYPNGFEWVPTK